MTKTAEKSQESRVRKLAKRQGYQVKKSSRVDPLNNRGIHARGDVHKHCRAWL